MGTCGIWKTPRIQRSYESYVNGHRLPQGFQITTLDRRSALATESRISSLMPCMFDNLAPCCRLMWDRNQSFMLDPSPTKDFRTNISTTSGVGSNCCSSKGIDKVHKPSLVKHANAAVSQTLQARPGHEHLGRSTCHAVAQHDSHMSCNLPP